MRTTVPFCLLALVVLCSVEGRADDVKKRLPRDKLLLYRGKDGKPLPVKTVEDWAKRRAEIVAGMESVMGKLPTDKKRRCDLDVKVEQEVECDGYVRRLITYASEPGSRVPAYLLIPKDVLKGKKKVAAILCLHPTDNEIGHGVAVGLGKRPNRAYAAELAKRGYVTLAPSYPLLAKYQPDLKKLGWQSGTLKAVWDNVRGLDLLASLPYVDGSKMGAIGHSLGGHNSVYTAVFDDRIKVVVSSCGLDSFLDYYKGDEKNWQPERGWCQTRYMRKLADYKGRLEEIPFDFHEMIGALAPRHVLIVAPKKDSNFRVDSVERIVKAAKPVYKLYGHEGRLMAEHPDCGHDFPDDMREKAYKLFDEVLKGK
jgi:dipeptidyl aminopeptidase/acylaminoacyl peptidase